MIETLLHVLETKAAEWLDRECEQRQQERVEARRHARNQEDSRAFHWQQELRQRADR